MWLSSKIGFSGQFGMKTKTDQRIAFVGGIRGHKPYRSGRIVECDGRPMYPTGMDQLFDLADANMLMPPKSTWFEPKLRGGVVLHHIAED